MFIKLLSLFCSTYKYKHVFPSRRHSVVHLEDAV
jgi:hypothetical protein